MLNDTAQMQNDETLWWFRWRHQTRKCSQFSSIMYLCARILAIWLVAFVQIVRKKKNREINECKRSNYVIAFVFDLFPFVSSGLEQTNEWRENRSSCFVSTSPSRFLSSTFVVIFSDLSFLSSSLGIQSKLNCSSYQPAIFRFFLWASNDPIQRITFLLFFELR